METHLGASYALDSGDGLSSHGTERSKAGVHGLVLHPVQLGVVARDHDGARPTPPLATPQLRATEVH